MREIQHSPPLDWTNYAAWFVCLIICCLSLYGAWMLAHMLWFLAVNGSDWFARSLWPMFWGK